MQKRDYVSTSLALTFLFVGLGYALPFDLGWFVFIFKRVVFDFEETTYEYVCLSSKKHATIK